MAEKNGAGGLVITAAETESDLVISKLIYPLTIILKKKTKILSLVFFGCFRGKSSSFPSSIRLDQGNFCGMLNPIHEMREASFPPNIPKLREYKCVLIIVCLFSLRYQRVGPNYEKPLRPLCFGAKASWVFS